MKYFIFRNYTCENFFPKYYQFSGYNEFYDTPTDIDGLVWFYQCPIKNSQNSVLAEVREYEQRISTILEQKDKNIPFIYCTTEIISLPIADGVGIYEIRRELEKLNQRIYELSLIDKSIKFIDLSIFLNNYAKQDIIDWKYFYYSQSIINPKLSKVFQVWWQSRQNALLLKRKKCLVVDLDNTLWHGVLGEDGIHGIQCGKDYPGACFHDFQLAILEATKNGIIVAICSKNNEADVLELWKKNTDVIIKDALVSAYRINWNSKASNIQEIAEELNIGLDSMVFIDDNPIEREQVHTLLPEVIVPEFPEKPSQLLNFFNKIYQEYFEIYQITDEDINKTAQYQANNERNTHKRTFSNIDDYLANLEMALYVKQADAQTVPRIAQMTQKTNQFNLTTPRYDEQVISKFVDDGHLVVTLGVKDKFGDNGVTVLSIIKIDTAKKIANIDAFLLSCRILGRGIESAFLKYLENKLFILGIFSLTARYIPTAKNKQTSDFYEKNGFIIVSETIDGYKEYSKELNQLQPIKSYYQFITQ